MADQTDRTSHLDGDRVVLLALGEERATLDERAHLETCAGCQQDLATLAEVAAVGRETQEVSGLPMPPARVWDRVAAATVGTPSPRRAVGRPRRTVLVALAAAVFGVVGTVGVGHVVERLGEPAVTASTALTAYGDTPATAHGSAAVIDQDGRPALRLHVADLPPGPGYYEVWLIDPGTLQMISVGVLGGQSDVVLPLPSTVDLKTYRLVDVSAEPYDGNLAHSGHSLLRGTLDV
jgi:hypothetical protein